MCQVGFGRGLRGNRDRARAAQFCTLNPKIAHDFHRECAIFASVIKYLVNIAKCWSKSRIKRYRNARFCTSKYFLT